jgi:DNA-binding transcriptional regulator YiaG
VFQLSDFVAQLADGIFSLLMRPHLTEVTTAGHHGREREHSSLRARSMPVAKKNIRVVISRSGSQWVASVADLAVSGHNTRTARRLITAMIRERYGQARFEVEIALPKSQGVAVQKYREDERLLRSLADSVPAARLRCIRELLAMNLSQEEVAELLGMTRSHLAVALKRAQTRASVAPTAPRRKA